MASVATLTARSGGAKRAARKAVAPAAAEAIFPEAVDTEGRVYRVIEVVGTSEKSIEEAISVAIHRASRTLRNVRWFEVVRTTGHVDNGQVAHYQVTLKVGFTMEGPG